MSGDKRSVGKSIGSAATPVPMNTPSLLRENKGRDITVSLVPTGGAAVWGASAAPEPKNDGYQAVAGTALDINLAKRGGSMPWMAGKPAEKGLGE
jgi:hypothetical protein